MKWLLIYLTLIFKPVNSGTEPKVVHISDEDFVIESIEGRVMGEWINSQVLLPRSIALKGDYLLVIENDFQVDEELFKLFSLFDERMAGHYARSGRGPGEIEGGIQKIPVYGADDRFTFLDYTRKRVSVIDIEDVLNGNHYKEPDLYKVLPPNFIHLQYGALLNDTLITGGGSLREGKLLFGNYQTNEYTFTDFIPEIEEKFSPLLKTNVYMSQLAINVNKEKVVVSNSYFNQIEIYNYHGDLELVITGDYSDQVFDTSPRRWASNNTITYYNNVVTTDDYIMAIYYNKTRAELRDEQGFIIEGIQSRVRIFDWEGNPVKEYILDRRVSRIVYDEKRKRIIAMDPDALESLIEYDVDL